MFVIVLCSFDGTRPPRTTTRNKTRRLCSDAASARNGGAGKLRSNTKRLYLATVSHTSFTLRGPDADFSTRISVLHFAQKCTFSQSGSQMFISASPFMQLNSHAAIDPVLYITDRHARTTENLQNMLKSLTSLTQACIRQYRTKLESCSDDILYSLRFSQGGE